MGKNQAINRSITCHFCGEEICGPRVSISAYRSTVTYWCKHCNSVIVMINNDKPIDAISFQITNKEEPR